MSSQASLGNILIIDDDQHTTDLLSLNLRSEGYNVTVKAHTSDVEFSRLRGTHLIIIDAARQCPDGLQFIRTVKEQPVGVGIGIIYFSEFDSDRILIDALDAGADDSICKPFSLREMMARIRAVMRRCGRVAAPAPRANVVNIENMRIDLTRKTVTIDNEFVNLSNTEYAILELLLHNRGTYTSRIEIFRNVWPDGAGANERIVDTNISRLRRKLGNLSSVIGSRTGLGYIIN